MTPYLPTSLIAQHPSWLYADFECRAFQISAELQQRQLRSVTIWLEYDMARRWCNIGMPTARCLAC